MITGRLLVGISIGVASVIVPLYISEISPTEIHGALASVDQLFICHPSWGGDGTLSGLVLEVQACLLLEKEWVGELLHYSPVVCDMSAIALLF
ncbi:hypothetical protein Fmac_018856 [Flemingia macrophylla]|uniref:Major facilitator superfamily (MFS) profile domain-containing protein n=1 Tax=Flemingia macrophylla TaxID=520843 RepID=A0ABD1M640_9FABA